MKNQTTYALLMRSEERGRNILETAVYAGCILSAVFAIWQFEQEAASVPRQLTSSHHVTARDPGSRA